MTNNEKYFIRSSFIIMFGLKYTRTKTNFKIKYFKICILFNKSIKFFIKNYFLDYLKYKIIY